MLHSAELNDVLPFKLVRCIRALSITGERRNYPELTVAALDLLHIMNSRLKERISKMGDVGCRKAWIESWLSLIQVTSDAAESKYPVSNYVSMWDLSLHSFISSNAPWSTFILIFFKEYSQKGRRNVGLVYA